MSDNTKTPERSMRGLADMLFDMAVATHFDLATHYSAARYIGRRQCLARRCANRMKGSVWDRPRCEDCPQLVADVLGRNAAIRRARRGVDIPTGRYPRR